MKALLTVTAATVLLMAGTLSARGAAAYRGDQEPAGYRGERNERSMIHRGQGDQPGYQGYQEQGYQVNGEQRPGVVPMAPRSDSLQGVERQNFYGDEGDFYGNPYYDNFEQGNYNYRDNPMYQSDVLRSSHSGEAEQVENTEDMEQEPDVG